MRVNLEASVAGVGSRPGRLVNWNEITKGLAGHSEVLGFSFVWAGKPYSITDTMDMSLSKLWRTGKPGVLQSMGSRRVGGYDLAIEQQQTKLLEQVPITSVWQVLYCESEVLPSDPTSTISNFVSQDNLLELFEAQILPLLHLMRSLAAGKFYDSKLYS